MISGPDTHKDDAEAIQQDNAACNVLDIDDIFDIKDQRMVSPQLPRTTSPRSQSPRSGLGNRRSVTSDDLPPYPHRSDSRVILESYLNYGIYLIKYWRPPTCLPQPFNRLEPQYKHSWSVQ